MFRALVYQALGFWGGFPELAWAMAWGEGLPVENDEVPQPWNHKLWNCRSLGNGRFMHGR